MSDRITNLQKPPEYWKKDKIKEYENISTILTNEMCGVGLDRISGSLNDYGKKVDNLLDKFYLSTKKYL